MNDNDSDNDCLCEKSNHKFENAVKEDGSRSVSVFAYLIRVFLFNNDIQSETMELKCINRYSIRATYRRVYTVQIQDVAYEHCSIPNLLHTV